MYASAGTAGTRRLARHHMGISHMMPGVGRGTLFCGTCSIDVTSVRSESGMHNVRRTYSCRGCEPTCGRVADGEGSR
jgi:hypothetical protein